MTYALQRRATLAQSAAAGRLPRRLSQNDMITSSSEKECHETRRNQARPRGGVRCCRLGGVGPDAQYHQVARHAQLRRQTGSSPDSACRTRRATGPASTSTTAARIAAAIFNDPTKVKFVALTAKDRFTALQSGEVDVLVAQHHLDLLARHLARPELHRRQLLRRPGLHGAQGAEGEFGARAQRRRGLRAAGHHHRAQSRGLFPRQQDEAQDRDLRERRRGHQGL